MKYHAQCHCGAVDAVVEAPEHVEVINCDCSICKKSGHLHLLVPAEKFELTSDPQNLSCYQFNSGIAKHYFCTNCGVKPFYIPRSNPDGYSVNTRCLEPKPASVTVSNFDGKNWEDHAASLAHLTKPSDS